MAELPDEDNIDLEALQAQIDLSLAHTKNLVSSWLTPASGTLSASSRKAEQDKEIEELLRRPPRLGVGAPLPVSTDALGIEGVKLKHKLAGKKRQRDSEDTAVAAAADSDEEDESRGHAIRKKTRVDPFNVGQGKKKKKTEKNEAQNAVKTISTPMKSVKDDSVDLVAADTLDSMISGSASQANATESERKKKKKKNRIHEPDVLPTLPHPSPLILTDGAENDHSSPLLRTESLTTPHTISSSRSKLSSSIIHSPSPGEPNDIPVQPGKAIPVLNLDGPPPSDTEDQPPLSSRKKRKRRKKKRSGGDADTTGAKEGPE